MVAVTPVPPLQMFNGRYEQLDSQTKQFIEEVERVGAAPVSLISTRFDFRSIIDRRAW
jgi:adenylosuccinate synthase